MSNIHMHEGARQAIEAVLVAADRYVRAQEALAARDWDAFKANELDAVSLEYERLEQAVADVRKRRMIPNATRSGSDDTKGNAP